MQCLKFWINRGTLQVLNSRGFPWGSTGGHRAGAEWVLSPQNSTLTIEEFHAKLQEATNFPLRPFVIPFLKVSVPSVPPVGLSAVTRGAWIVCKPFVVHFKIPFVDIFFPYFFFTHCGGIRPLLPDILAL